MRRSTASLTIVENYPRMLAVLAASVAGCVAFLWAFVVLGSSMASAASPTYTIKDLGTLGGTYSTASGINDSGQVVGVSEISNGARHTFLYTGGQMQDLNQGTASSESRANDINGSGQVVGVSDFTRNHAFLYTGGQMRDLGTLPGGTRSLAQDINDTGEVVGVANASSGATHAFVNSGDQMHDLNDLIPTGSGWELTTAFAINASGQIVGEGLINGQTRAFLATPDTTTPPDSTPPRVKSTVPKANANGVAPTANVRATFSEEMDSDTIDGTTFKLFKKGTTTQIVATVSYNADTDTAKLDPANNLRRGVAYMAVVTTRAEDVAGNRLDQDSSTSGLQQKRWFFIVDN